MTIPDVVRLRNYRTYPPPQTSGEIRTNWLEWKAPDGKVFVAVILGTENKDGTDPLPIIDFLRNLVIDGVEVVPSTEATHDEHS